MVIPHALVVPGSGLGHINGCLELSRALTAVGFKVSFVYFSYVYANLKRKNLVQDFTESAISVHVVDDGRDPDVPSVRFEVTPAMQQGLYDLIVELNDGDHDLTCLVSDSFMSWTHDVADRAAICWVEFWTSTAMSYLMMANLDILFQNGTFPEKGSPKVWRRESPIMLDHIQGLPAFPSHFYPHYIRFGDAHDPLNNFLCKMGKYVKHSNRLLVHSISQLEPIAFKALKLAGIQAHAIGPLFHHHDHHTTASKKNVTCISWLRNHPPKSVIYISFGSHMNLPKEDIYELAIGLEATGCPFLWALREDKLDQILPQDFLARNSKNGMIVPWVPQFDVLAHPSIGVFLSHCGWNSTMESLWFGVPIIGYPIGAEQFSNVHYIANVWKVGLELERSPTSGIDSKVLVNCVRMVMEEEVGKNIKHNVQQVMTLGRTTCQEGGESMNNLETFYQDMKVLSSNEPH